MKSGFVFILVVFSYTNIRAQTVHYVDQSATGGMQTGATWGDAFTDLQAALAVAHSGDAIWVAGGTYKPTLGADRTVSFRLVDGVQLFGGFSGTETALSQRDFETNKTILSGDIGIPGELTDNAYHVVRGKGLGSNTVLDGFYITGGYSYNESPAAIIDRFGAGMLLEGAAAVANSRPVIQHCWFEKNYGDEGGAVCITWTDPVNPAPDAGPVNPVLRYCTFSRNLAARRGGGIYKNGPSGGADTFVLEDCRFLDNRTFVGDGGAIYFATTANAHTTIRRCVFERDTALGGTGGAIAYPASFPEGNSSDLLLDSCTFRQNIALEGASFNYDGYTPQAPKVVFNCRMQNCRFERNYTKSSHGAGFLFYVDLGGVVNVDVESCVFEGNLSGSYSNLVNLTQNGTSHLKVNRCEFINNHYRSSPNSICLPLGNGGGGYTQIQTEVTNCVFKNNGGGIGVLSGKWNQSTTHIANCTFYNNSQYIFVKTWDSLYLQPNGYYNDFYVDNCIIWEPGTSLIKAFYNNNPMKVNMYSYHFNNCLLSLTDSVSVPGSAEAFEEGLIWGQFPGFEDSLSGNLRLKPCSPAVGKGNNQVAYDWQMLTDFDGLPRIRYGTVDIGAFEQQDSCAVVAAPGAPEGQLFPSLWPNPSADGILHWAIPGLDANAGRIEIINTQGQVVFCQDHLRGDTLNLEHLPRGLYGIRFMKPDGGAYATGKWIRL